MRYSPSSKTWAGARPTACAGGTRFDEPNVSALAQTADGLYAGGGFGIAGAVASENIALWTPTAFTLEGDRDGEPGQRHRRLAGDVHRHAAQRLVERRLRGDAGRNDPEHGDVRLGEPAQGTCSIAGRVLTCQLGTLAAGASTTVQIVLKPTAAGTVSNTITGKQTGSTYTALATATVTAK